MVHKRQGQAPSSQAHGLGLPTATSPDAFGPDSRPRLHLPCGSVNCWPASYAAYLPTPRMAYCIWERLASTATRTAFSDLHMSLCRSRVGLTVTNNCAWVFSLPVGSC